jgi:hypothetical protein
MPLSHSPKVPPDTASNSIRERAVIFERGMTELRGVVVGLAHDLLHETGAEHQSPVWPHWLTALAATANPLTNQTFRDGHHRGRGERIRACIQALDREDAEADANSRRLLSKCHGGEP